MAYPASIQSSIIIEATVQNVWEYLTVPTLMKTWMAEPELQLEIQTSWMIGSSILMNGFHTSNFQNKGKVLCFNPPYQLQYTHLNSLSNLTDDEENYTHINFQLKPFAQQTLLFIELSNFPTETIYKHLHLYWISTLTLLKEIIESRNTIH